MAAMDIGLSLPLPPTILAIELADLVESGGTTYSVFLAEHCDVDYEAMDDACAICQGRMDPKSSDNEYGYLSNDPERPQTQDRLLMRKDRCTHVFHCGCFHRTVELGSGAYRCPMCRKEWYTEAKDLYHSTRIRGMIWRIIRGDFNDTYFILSRGSIVVHGYRCADAFAMVACALRKKYSWNDEVTADVVKITTQLVTLVIFMHGWSCLPAHLSEHLSGDLTDFIRNTLGHTEHSYKMLSIGVVMMLGLQMRFETAGILM